MFSFLKKLTQKGKQETSSETEQDSLQQAEQAPQAIEPDDINQVEISEPALTSESASIPVPAEQDTATETETHTTPEPVVEEKPEKVSFFGRLKQGLSRTSNKLTEGFASLILGKKTIDDELLEELETQLLTADLGVEATQTIIEDLTARVERKQLGDAEALFNALRDDMVELLRPTEQALTIPDTSNGPFVLLMVGINGVGKTTTIGKLAKQFQQQGKSVMLAAGDTFRAAAVEQLQVWGERNDIPVIAQKTGSDSASVIFDALQAAKARNTDILIADTAGRLHTQSNLMEELKKVKRVMGKIDESAPHEVMLVLDAGTGQNALSQAKQFHDAVGVTGLTLTKLDGTAKGGIIFAIAKKIGLPIRYIGVGEKIDDLREFKSEDFVDALLGRED
jgi:fused signal recognition particle receptor